MTHSTLRNLAFALALAGAWSSGRSAQAALIVIDDFELPGAPSPANGGYLSPGSVPTPGNPLKTQHNGPDTSIIGGQRDVFVQQTSGNVDGDSAVVVGINPLLGQFDQNTSVDGVLYSAVQYDGDDLEAPDGFPGNAAGLLVDLTSSGANDEFLMRFTNAQVPVTNALSFFFEVTSPNGGYSFHLGSRPDLLTVNNIPQAVDHLIPFASFTGNADFSMVNSITVYFNDDGDLNGSVGADFAVDLIAAVPEPSGAVLLGMAAVGLAIPSWRRRNRVVRR